MVIHVLVQFSNTFACCGLYDTEKGLSSDHAFFGFEVVLVALVWDLDQVDSPSVQHS